MAKKVHDEKEEKAEKAEKAEKVEKAEESEQPAVDMAVDLSADPDSVNKPYPQGNPPDPEEIFEKIHGYKRQKE